MANHASAEKRHRQSLKRRDRNRQVRSAVRKAIKSTRSAVEDGNLEEARTLFLQAQSRIAKAANKGVYHTRTAQRKVGRLAALINRATAANS